MIRWLVVLLSIFFDIYTTNNFFTKISNRNFAKMPFWLLNVVFAVFQVINNIFLSKLYLFIIFSSVFFFLISFLYKMKIQTRILASIFLCVVFAGSKLCVALISTTLIKIDLSYTQNNIFLLAIHMISAKLLAFSIIQLLNFKKSKAGEQISVSFALKTVPFPLASFAVLILLFKCCYKINELTFNIFILIASLLLFLANIFIFYMLDRQKDYIETKEQLYFAQNHIKNQIAHYNELYQYQKDICKFKHDIKNKLLAILGLVNNNEIQKASLLLTRDLNMLDDYGGSLINTGNPIVDAVIQSKVNTAKAKNIDIDVSVNLKKNIEINELDLGVVIGNALDNAIEATEKVDSAHRTPIEISLITVEDQLSLSIKNTVKDKINIKNLISSKMDEVNHGHGIKSIKSIVKKYKGVILFSCKNNIFSISVSLVNLLD